MHICIGDLCFVLSGEFTLRAFLNGRLDLSQAENVARLITAKSVAAADAALEGIQACLTRLCLYFCTASSCHVLVLVLCGYMYVRLGLLVPSVSV